MKILAQMSTSNHIIYMKMIELYGDFVGVGNAKNAASKVLAHIKEVIGENGDIPLDQRP